MRARLSSSGFLLGSVQSGLMVLHRRTKLQPDGPPHSLPFAEQSGEPLLNFFRPRGALCVPLRLRDGSRIVVANTHTNAESSKSARRWNVAAGPWGVAPVVPEPAPGALGGGVSGWPARWLAGRGEGLGWGGFAKLI